MFSGLFKLINRSFSNKAEVSSRIKLQKRRLSINRFFVRLLNYYHNIFILNSIKIYIESKIIKNNIKNLFDINYYGDSDHELENYNKGLLDHFVRYGQFENRNPHMLFDTLFYKGQFANYPRNVNPLVHFYLIGRRDRISPTPWFSYDAYIERNSDVLASKLEPFDHFIRYGVYENRVSSDAFDALNYVQRHPDVLSSGMSALHHYIRIGITEGRSGTSLSAQLKGNDTANPSLFADGPIERQLVLDSILSVKKKKTSPLVDVIIPVYRNYFLTLACLRNALVMRNKTAYEVIVIDDFSPEPELSAALESIAKNGLITLITHNKNEGFVRSVNEGMRLHANRDVILLNSDTEVYGNWIDRLRTAAYKEPNISTVTPLTNSGTICSYPNFCKDNVVPNDLTIQQLDQIASRANKGRYVEAPTAVGFCMYIKRAALKDVGLFDEKAFGTGYGEENDFCLRAQRNGWKDIISVDTFVRHYGSASFLGEKNERVLVASRVINARYPGYDKTIQDWILKDPVKPFRAKLDHERLVRQKALENVLVITHLRGGGTEQSVNDRTQKHMQAGRSVFRLHAGAKNRKLAFLSHHKARNLPNVRSYNLADDEQIDRLCEMLRQIEISKIEIHHLGDFWIGAPNAFLKVVQTTGIPFHFFAHDYHSICPRTNLVDRDGIYCGEPNSDGCAQCLRLNASDFGAPNIEAWRSAYQELLTQADLVIVPNDDGQKRLSRYFPNLKVTVEPHDNVLNQKYLPRGRAHHEKIRVGTIGAISNLKGLNVLCDAARYSMSRNLPLEFVVVGYTSNDARCRKFGLEITGPYTNDKVLKTITESGISAIFIPSTCPEMYSYVLSIAFETGLPIIAFDIGAIANRLQDIDHSLVLPLEFAKHPDRVTQNIIDFCTKMNV